HSVAERRGRDRLFELGVVDDGDVVDMERTNVRRWSRGFSHEPPSRGDSCANLHVSQAYADCDTGDIGMSLRAAFSARAPLRRSACKAVLNSPGVLAAGPGAIGEDNGNTSKSPLET